MNLSYTEYILGGVGIVLAGVLLNPGYWEMSSALEMLIVALLVVSIALFGGLIWKERVNDEREQYHRMFADRIGFIAGLIFAVGLVAKQSLTHTLDKDVLVLIILMIMVKIGAVLYVRSRY